MLVLYASVFSTHVQAVQLVDRTAFGNNNRGGINHRVQKSESPRIFGMLTVGSSFQISHKGEQF